MSLANSEAASKKAPRGRPRLYGEDERNAYRDLWPHLGPRQLETTIRMQGALAILFATPEDMSTDPRFRWLFNPSGKVRKSILCELGRLHNEDVLPLALALCESKPKTKDAVARLRRYRLGRKDGKPRDLAVTICRTIDAYRERFELSQEETLQALRVAMAAVTDAFAAGLQEAKP